MTSRSRAGSTARPPAAQRAAGPTTSSADAQLDALDALGLAQQRTLLGRRARCDREHAARRVDQREARVERAAAARTISGSPAPAATASVTASSARRSGAEAVSPRASGAIERLYGASRPRPPPGRGRDAESAPPTRTRPAACRGATPSLGVDVEVGARVVRMRGDATSRSRSMPRPGPSGSERWPFAGSIVGRQVTRSCVQGSLKASKCSWIRKFGTQAASCRQTAVATGPPLWCGAI